MYSISLSDLVNSRSKGEPENLENPNIQSTDNFVKPDEEKVLDNVVEAPIVWWKRPKVVGGLLISIILIGLLVWFLYPQSSPQKLIGKMESNGPLDPLEPNQNSSDLSIKQTVSQRIFIAAGSAFILIAIILAYFFHSSSTSKSSL